MIELPDYNKITFPDMPGLRWEEVVPDAPNEAIALLKQFLCYSSDKRTSGRDVNSDVQWIVKL
jgi:cell cycle related kinase